MASGKIGADPIKSKNGDELAIAGRFIGIAGPGVQAVPKSGKGWTVARTGAGVYVVTFQNPFQKFFGAPAVVMSATLGRDIQATAYSITGGTYSITYTVTDSATKAVTDLGTSDEVWFVAHVGLSVMS